MIVSVACMAAPETQFLVYRASSDAISRIIDRR